MIRQKDGFQGSRILVLPQLVVNLLEKDEMTAALHLTDIGYFPKATNHFRESLTPIDQYVFIYCVDGKGWYKVNGKFQTVRANQYFILPSGQPHSYGTDERHSWTIYWIHFKGHLAAHYARHALCPVSVEPRQNSRIQTRVAIFEEIFTTLQSGYAIDNLYYASSLLHYFFGSLLNIQQFRAGQKEDSNDGNAVQQSIHYMKENLEKRLTLEDIAGYIGYSVSHYSMLFKQMTGHTPLAYLNLLKIQQACYLLDATDMKINQICFKIGIDDSYYFSRLFTKIMGMSPRSYRQQRKG